MIVIITYLAYFLTSTLAPIQRRFIFSRKNADPKDQIRFAFELMVILVLGSLAFQFFSPLYFAGDKIHLFLLTLVCGIFGMGYFILNFSTQKHVDAGVTSVVVNIFTPVSIVLSSVLLEEGLQGLQILGTMLLLTAMVVISKKHRVSTFHFDKNFMAMLLSGILLGVLLVAERALQKQTGLTGATMLSWGAQCFFLGIAVLVLKCKHSYQNKEVLSTGFITMLSSMSYVILVYVVGNLSLVSSITTFKIVTIFIAGAIFLKEREDLGRKIFGSVLALIGLLLMK